jgi:hypothetical protein
MCVCVHTLTDIRASWIVGSMYTDKVIYIHTAFWKMVYDSSKQLTHQLKIEPGTSHIKKHSLSNLSMFKISLLEERQRQRMLSIERIT